MVESDHPLWIWLQAHGETVDELCARVGTFGRWWTYKLVRGLIRHPQASYLRDIQTATGGAVSIEEMLDYVKKHTKAHAEPAA